MRRAEDAAEAVTLILSGSRMFSMSCWMRALTSSRTEERRRLTFARAAADCEASSAGVTVFWSSREKRRAGRMEPSIKACMSRRAAWNMGWRIKMRSRRAFLFATNRRRRTKERQSLMAFVKRAWRKEGSEETCL